MGEDALSSKRRKRRVKWRFLISASVLLLLVLGWYLTKSSSGPFKEDPNLVVTTTQTSKVIPPPNAGVLFRLQTLHLSAKQWWNRRSITVSAEPREGYEKSQIWVLLSTASELTGRLYFIEKEYSNAGIPFATSKPLGAKEFMAAVEAAVLGSPTMWDWNEEKFVANDLRMLRYNSKVILVLSAGTATNYMAKYPRLKPHEPGD